MFGYTTLVGLVTLAAAINRSAGNIVADYYEEEVSYAENPLCAPSKLDKGVCCDKVGASIEVQGGLVSVLNED